MCPLHRIVPMFFQCTTEMATVLKRLEFMWQSVPKNRWSRKKWIEITRRLSLAEQWLIRFPMTTVNVIFKQLWKTFRERKWLSPQKLEKRDTDLLSLDAIEGKASVCLLGASQLEYPNLLLANAWQRSIAFSRARWHLTHWANLAKQVRRTRVMAAGSASTVFQRLH